MARLIQRIGHDGRFRHVRDQSYFDWRFRNPFREYRFLYAGDAELDGYLVLKRESAERASIVDLEAVNSRVRAALLKTAVTAGAFSNLTIWTSSADGQLMEELAALEFEPSDSQPAGIGPTFLVRMIDLELPEAEWRVEDGRQLLEHGNWDIRMLYSMAG